MDQSHSITKKRRCPHLTFEERVIIKLRLCDGWSPNRIAKEHNRAPNTISAKRDKTRFEQNTEEGIRAA